MVGSHLLGIFQSYHNKLISWLYKLFRRALRINAAINALLEIIRETLCIIVKLWWSHHHTRKISTIKFIGNCCLYFWTSINAIAQNCIVLCNQKLHLFDIVLGAYLSLCLHWFWSVSEYIILRFMLENWYRFEDLSSYRFSLQINKPGNVKSIQLMRL